MTFAAHRLPAIDGRFRLAFVLFGGMLVLQSSQTLDARKLAFLAGAGLCVLGAVAAVSKGRASPAVRSFGPWLLISSALVILMAVSVSVARTQGTSLVDWARDAASYALFASVPVLALDASASASRRLLVGMLVVAGLLGGVSWALEWLGRRHIADLPLARLVFPSGQLPSLLYLFAMGSALIGGRRSVAWAALGGVVLGLFLVTGTRSSLVLLIGPLAMVWLVGRARLGSSIRTLLAHGAAALGLVLVVQLALTVSIGPGSASPGEPRSSVAPGGAVSTPWTGSNVVGDRIGSLPTLAGNLAADPSFKERVAQYEAAARLFLSSPIVGVGPGHSIEWINVSGLRRTGYTADTPLVMPAKFGLLGILVFLAAAWAYGSTARRGMLRFGRSAVTLTLVGYGLWTIVGLPLGFPVEDKGTSLALMLLLSLALTEYAARLDTGDAVADRQPSQDRHRHREDSSTEKAPSAVGGVGAAATARGLPSPAWRATPWRRRT